MKALLRYLALLLMTLPVVGRAAAQTPEGGVVAEVHFRWDSDRLDPTYLTNTAALRQLRSEIERVGVEQIDSVVVVSHASPEGTSRYNERLARRRAATMERYMSAHYPALHDRLTIRANGESWAALRERIAADQRLKNSTIERLLAILDDPATSIDTKRWRIEHDPVWRYLYRTHYPEIRHSMICLVYYRKIEQQEPVALVVEQPAVPIRPTEVASAVVEPLRDTVTVAVKSNLLYDAVTALNAEVEVPIGRRWSLAVEYLFPWWEHENKYCLQLLNLGFEGRYWLREQARHKGCLQGWFAGPYLMSGMYDLQWDREVNYQGEFWSAGVTAGYAMRLSKRLNLEFSLSVGYLSTAYRHYFPADDYSELYRDGKSGRTNYIGPTKAKIALVWPLHFSYKKGGRR